MTAKEVLVNIEGYDLWEFYDYKLSRAEAETVVKALRLMVGENEEDGE